MIYDEVDISNHIYGPEKTYSFIDILVLRKVKEKWLFLVKYYSYIVHEYILEKSDTFGYLIKINEFSNTIIRQLKQYFDIVFIYKI